MNQDPIIFPKPAFGHLGEGLPPPKLHQGKRSNRRNPVSNAAPSIGYPRRHPSLSRRPSNASTCFHSEKLDRFLCRILYVQAGRHSTPVSLTVETCAKTAILACVPAHARTITNHEELARDGLVGDYISFYVVSKTIRDETPHLSHFFAPSIGGWDYCAFPRRGLAEVVMKGLRNPMLLWHTKTRRESRDSRSHFACSRPRPR